MTTNPLGSRYERRPSFDFNYIYFFLWGLLFCLHKLKEYLLCNVLYTNYSRPLVLFFFFFSSGLLKQVSQTSTLNEVA